MNNFIVRSLTGLLFVLAVVAAIFIHPFTFLTLFVLVAILLMVELEKLICEKRDGLLLINSIVLGCSVFVLSFLNLHSNISQKWFLLLLPLIWLPFLVELFRVNSSPFQKVANYLLITTYVALPMFSLSLLAYMGGTYHPELLLAFFIMVWINDTGAYLVGVNFGRKRLFERISPKKSWEGFIGGIVLTTIVAGLLNLWVQVGSLSLWLICGIVVSLFGTLGDLVESMLKRSFNKKDSGSILPGHGGVLDRFDGALFAAPLICVLFYIFGN